MELTKNEITNRIEKLFENMNRLAPNWTTVLIFGKINQYYLTGTMQDGVFALKKDGSYTYFVRRSFPRAEMESKIDEIQKINTYRDMIPFLGDKLGNLYVDKDIVNITILDRLNKYFSYSSLSAVEPVISKIRAVKSEYELYQIKKSGEKHRYILEDIVPALLKEGMTEIDFLGDMYREMLKIGYQGLARFAMFQTEMVLGQFGFGATSAYPTPFDGPGGMKGLSPAVPLVGNSNTVLKKGDLVFVDIAFGVEGYHSDCTQIYMFGEYPSDDLQSAHRKCLEVQQAAAAMLKPGAIPSEIYKNTVETLPSEFRENFMGLGMDAVKFLGHGVGLHIDEYPVIAAGFNEPLEENMIIALEPKKHIPGIGIVGVEDTYLVTKNGGKCLTGGEKEIVTVFP